MRVANGGTAVLVASKDGASSIQATIEAARTQAHVFVVSDGSTDDTAAIAREAGATVLELAENVGKANALRQLLDFPFEETSGERLPVHFDSLLVVDDDTVIDSGFVAKCSKVMDSGDVAVVEGMCLADTPTELRWNAIVGIQAISYWWVSTIVKRVQGWFRARTWLNGAACLFRSDVLDHVAEAENWTVTEDYDWCWQIYRQKLGKVRYVPSAVCRVQCPTNLSTLYKQWLRWAWGTYQVTFRRKVGIHPTKSDALWAYGTLRMLWDLVAYVVVGYALVTSFSQSAGAILPFMVGIPAAIGVVVALRTQTWRLALMGPLLIPVSVMWAVVSFHGFFKAVRQPTSTNVRWTSPDRYAPAA